MHVPLAVTWWRFLTPDWPQKSLLSVWLRPKRVPRQFLRESSSKWAAAETTSPHHAHTQRACATPALLCSHIRSRMRAWRARWPRFWCREIDNGNRWDGWVATRVTTSLWEINGLVKSDLFDTMAHMARAVAEKRYYGLNLGHGGPTSCQYWLMIFVDR